MVSKLFNQQPPIIQVTPTDDSEGIQTAEESQERPPRGSFSADKRPKKKDLMKALAPPRERKRSSRMSKGSRLSKVSKAAAAAQKGKRRLSKKIWPTNAKFWSKIAGYNSRLSLPVDEAPYSIHIKAMENSPSATGSKYGHRFYEIFEQAGPKLYFAAEKSKYSGGSRPLELTFLDTSDNVMMTLKRKDSSMLCCCGAKCFGNNATIYDNQRTIIGELKQQWRCGVLRFNLNLPGLPDMRNIIIKGPDRHVCCLSYIGDDVTFEVFSAQKDELTGALEQTRIGIYRLYSTPAPFHDNPAVLRLETQIEPSPEFQGVLIAVGALLHLSYFDENPGPVCDCYGGCFLTHLMCFLIVIFVLVAIFISVFFIPSGLSIFKMLLFSPTTASPTTLTNLAASTTMQPNGTAAMTDSTLATTTTT